MKKERALALLGIICLMFICIAGERPASAAENPITLRIASWETETAVNGPVHQAWADELEKKTNGKYKAKIVWGGGMGRPDEHYDIVRKGLADVAFISCPFTPGVFPMSDIVGLPWILPTAKIANQATWEFYKKGYLDKEFAEIKPLFVWSGPGFGLYSTKPFNSLSAIRGKKILTGAGEAETKRTTAMKAVPVAGTPFEWYIMLQKGVADAVFASWEAVGGTKVYEVAPYCVDLSMCNVTMMLAMNKKTYSRMPKDIQKIVEQLTEDILVPKTAVRGDSCVKENANLLLNAGGKINKWSDADMAELNTQLTSLWDWWITKNESNGLPASKAVDAYWTILKSLGVESPSVGYTPNK